MNASTPPAAAVVSAGDGERHEFDWGEIVWLVSGERGNSDTMTFGKVTIRAGHANPPHGHPNCDEVLHLLTGELQHSLGDRSVTLRAGDTLVIPRGITHQACAIGTEDAVMLVSYNTAHRQVQGE